MGWGLEGEGLTRRPPACACRRRWPERERESGRQRVELAAAGSGCGQRLRVERCGPVEHAAGGQLNPNPNTSVPGLFG